MRLYGGQYFREYDEEMKNRVTSEIITQSDSYLLNVSVDDYTLHLEQKYKIDIPELHLDEVFADSIERDIPASQFPQYDFMFLEDKKYKKEVIIYHVPYSGNINLLQYRPNPMNLTAIDVEIDQKQSCLLIEVINFYNDAEKIKYEYNQQLNSIIPNLDYLTANFNNFNNCLTSYIKSQIETRRQQLLSKNNLLSSLGIPLKKREGVADTFSVPKPKLKEKVVITKPNVKDSNFIPEPTLDEANYRKILKIINDVGKNLERLPSTYKGKSEEEIRDSLLIILDPNFEYGSASGETFNKIGKTDICLRYDSSVVFIAECKYWKGEKGFLSTIDQLLGYLTWRDSKIAVINFVQNAEFTDVLTKIKNSIISHPNFLKYTSDTDETWSNYKFHLNGDRNRILDLAVISFHLPK